MKILNVKQTQELDTFTIAREPIASIDLMERASRAFVQAFIKDYSRNYEINVFCGLGNNGGDGLAIARLLWQLGYQVKTFVIQYTSAQSPDFQKNLARLKSHASVWEIHQASQFPKLPPNSIIIDALLGSGLSRPLEGMLAEIVQDMNQHAGIIVSVDIPSGLFMEKPSPKEHIVKAHKTISFQLPKLAFMLPENAPYVGDWQVVPIGLDEHFISQASSDYFYLDSTHIKSLYKSRLKFAHKGNFGHALLMVGSYGKMGAGILASRAALRTGVGLLTVHVPACGYDILQNTVAEAMISTDPAEKMITRLPELPSQGYAAIGLGCGIGQSRGTAYMIQSLLNEIKKPLVLDADALNLISQDKNLLEYLPKHSILSPHPKEFERIVGKTENHFERLNVLQSFAIAYEVFVILKGAHTAIACPSGSVYFNSTGNPGMATAGSGDVLTGMLTALLAQEYSPQEAALLGVYLHGLAGDLALAHQSQESLIASDLIDHLGMAFKEMGA